MQTDLQQAQRALAFAKAHDWGEGARLDAQADGSYRICGLVDAYTQRQPDGSVTYHETLLTLDASIRALRDFGGY